MGENRALEADAELLKEKLRSLLAKMVDKASIMDDAMKISKDLQKKEAMDLSSLKEHLKKQIEGKILEVTSCLKVHLQNQIAGKISAAIAKPSGEIFEAIGKPSFQLGVKEKGTSSKAETELPYLQTDVVNSFRISEEESCYVKAGGV